MKIVICASIAFAKEIQEAREALLAAGHEVVVPYVVQRMIDGEMSEEERSDILSNKEDGKSDLENRAAQPVDLIKRYWDKIEAADAILVLNLPKNDIEGYIGGSTLMEMGFAYGHGKKIFLYRPIPERSERMHYVDELVDMKPVVIDGDLSKTV